MSHQTPGQNYDHLLLPIQGYDGMHDLQFIGYTEDGEDWHRGALMGLNPAGQLTPFFSLAAAIKPRAMPLFALNASYDFDVAGGTDWAPGSGPLYRQDAGNIAGQTLAANNIDVLRRHIATYVGTGGYELVTTEFDPTATYAENDPLIAYTVTGGEAVGVFPEGWVTVGTIQAGGELALEENVVGVISRVDVDVASGIRKEVYQQDVIQFWPVYLPARTVTP